MIEENGATLLHGDCRAVMRTLEAESVHCVVTSPPYWGLRDYGCEGQIGLEATPEEHVAALLEVFREVWRVLRKDGTLWLNYGDAYESGTRATRDYSKTTKHGYWNNPAIDKRVSAGLKPKDLIGLPWMLAFALRADGWWLRSDIIWSKRNPMPESVTDRPTRAHEYLFLLAKADRYFYDADAIREPQDGINPAHPSYRPCVVNGTGSPNHQGAKSAARLAATGVATGPAIKHLDPRGRNKRTVWEINTQPTPEAHFATFPEALVEPCIMAGTSEWGCCPECGTPWERVVEKECSFESGSGRSGNPPVGKNGAGMQGGGETLDVRRGPTLKVQTVGWKAACRCGSDETVPAVVLDPFAGSGTVGKVATRLGRRSILIDLNEEYLKIARKRTAQKGLML